MTTPSTGSPSLAPSTASHLVGLLLGTEDDWPTAFEHLVRELGPVVDWHGVAHTLETERVTIEPFSLR